MSMDPIYLRQIELATFECFREHRNDRLELDLQLDHFFALVSMVQLAMRHPDAPEKTIEILRARLEDAIADLPDHLEPMRHHLTLGWTETL